MITVWSERVVGGPWTDCVYAAGLMAFDYGDFGAWPLGHHTDAERDALEASQTMFVPNTGANFAALHQATLARYGFRLWPLDTDLPTALATPGLGLVLAGLNGRWPADSYQRRHDQAFTGNHAIFVVGWAVGTVMMFDPLAPMGYPGDEIEASKIMQWANGGGPNDALRVWPGWYAPAPVPAPVPTSAPAPEPSYADGVSAERARWLAWYAQRPRPGVAKPGDLIRWYRARPA